MKKYKNLKETITSCGIKWSPSVLPSDPPVKPKKQNISKELHDNPKYGKMAEPEWGEIKPDPKRHDKWKDWIPPKRSEPYDAPRYSKKADIFWDKMNKVDRDKLKKKDIEDKHKKIIKKHKSEESNFKLKRYSPLFSEEITTSSDIGETPEHSLKIVQIGKKKKKKKDKEKEEKK